MDNLYEYFYNMFKSDKVGHAFLVGNLLFDENKDILKKIISDFFFFKDVNLEENPDIYIVRPEGNNISKAQIKALLNKLNTTSQFNINKVYIITEVERLSDSVYNTLLKTIEEPNENVYAFLITSNMNNVPETIKSRCQCIFVSSSIVNNNNLFRALALEILEQIEKYGIETSANYSEIYKKVENRNALLEILKEIYDIYMNILYNKVGVKSVLNGIFTLENDIDLICKKILFINSLIEKGNFNINKDILIDEIIYGIWRCNYEAGIC